MVEEADPLEQIAFLARSPARVRLLELLLEADSATRRDCREELDASRSTVSRTLDAMEERGWVEASGHAYELTPAGSIVAESFLDVLETIETTDEFSAFLRRFPIESFDLDLAALRDADVVASQPGDPYAPATRQTDLLREAGAFRGLLPSIEVQGCRLVRDRVVDGDLDAETVVSPSVASTITEGEYATLFADMLETDRHDLFAAEEPLPFYLGLTADGTVHVGVEDDEGYPRALLVSDAPEVRDWAEECYEEHRERARALSVDAFES